MRSWIGTEERWCFRCQTTRQHQKYIDNSEKGEYFYYVCAQCHAVVTEKIPSQKPIPPDKNDPASTSIFDRLPRGDEQDKPGN